jgi:AcrR family transcriptional regulator
MKETKPRKYDRRSRQAAAEATQRRIVRATVELHAEHGALGTTHEMIAHRATVSIPTVYKYFQTRNDLIPHCVGMALAEAPRLDASVFEGHPDMPSRLRALARRAFAFYEYASPWLRWSARDATELPALRTLHNEAARNREMLIRTGLAPGVLDAPAPALLALASVLLDFPSWQTLTAAGLATAEAANAIGNALVTLVSNQPKENL